MTNKEKIKPYCRWCHNEMCVNDDCPSPGFILDAVNRKV